MTNPLDDASHVVVVSPHLDDAALSLGATIARAARRGSRVVVLTVFGCDPSSHAPAGGWDGRAGFRTEGEAARVRREEDAKACALLGAAPVWLSFGSLDYERRGNDAAVRDAVLAATGAADVVLLPGFPLSHPDHVALVRALAGDRLRGTRLGLYAEQPYTRRSGEEPRPAGWVDEALGGPLVFRPGDAGVRDRIAKWRAIRQYRSQLPLLGMRRSLRRGPRSMLWGELVAWVDPTFNRGQAKA